MLLRENSLIICGLIHTKKIKKGRKIFVKIMENKPKIKERTLAKYLSKRVLITVVAYSLGVLLVDFLGYKYVGLGLIPITFSMDYLLSKHWVFKKNENK